MEQRAHLVQREIDDKARGVTQQSGVGAAVEGQGAPFTEDSAQHAQSARVAWVAPRHRLHL